MKKYTLLIDGFQRYSKDDLPEYELINSFKEAIKQAINSEKEKSNFSYRLEHYLNKIENAKLIKDLPNILVIKENLMLSVSDANDSYKMLWVEHNSGSTKISQSK